MFMPTALSFSRSNPFGREPSPKGWFDPAEQQKNEDPLALLKETLLQWIERLREGEQLADKHVYSNPNFSQLDARQHRHMLHYLIWKGEDLALELLRLQRPEETSMYVSIIDDEVSDLNRKLQEWHGDPADAAIPESFKQAMREAEAGQTVDMEEDLFASNAPSETHLQA
jgi:hypothetical protein